MTQIESIILRMRESVSAKSDVELASYLNLSKSSVISTWKSRGKIPFVECLEVSQKENVSLDWLIKGVDKSLKSDSDSCNTQESLLLELIGRDNIDQALISIRRKGIDELLATSSKTKEDQHPLVEKINLMMSDLPDDVLKEILLDVIEAQQAHLTGVPFQSHRHNLGKKKAG